MNARTAKLLNRFALVTRARRKEAKRVWNRTTKPNRCALRVRIKDILSDGRSPSSATAAPVADVGVTDNQQER